MKKLIVIFLGIVSNSLLGQNLNFKDYCNNNYQVFSVLNDSYKNEHFIAYIGIRGITETKFWYDTLGNISDSSIVNSYQFDSLGRIIEKRFDYRLHSTKYEVIKFLYTEDGKIKVVKPYLPLYGIYTKAIYPLTNCEYYNESGNVETIDVQTSHNYNMKYYYTSINTEQLISRLTFLKDNKLKYRHEITYE